MSGKLGAVGGELGLVGERYDPSQYSLVKLSGQGWLLMKAGGGGDIIPAPASAPVPTILAPAAPVVPATKPATEALGHALSVGKRGGIRPLFGPAWEGDRR